MATTTCTVFVRCADFEDQARHQLCAGYFEERLSPAMLRCIVILFPIICVGCATSRSPEVAVRDSGSIDFPVENPKLAVTDVPELKHDVADKVEPFVLTAFQTESEIASETESTADLESETELDLKPDSKPNTILPADVESVIQLIAAPAPVSLQDVVESVHRSYPLVRAAYQERQIANGNQLSAWGEFDTKLKASSENQPLGFYETYRNQAGFHTPLYGGGEVFGGYRNGGGDFEPWYQERETNDGGEFKAGVRVPLIRDRDIDARRAALWRATYDQQIADPVIRANLVMFSREAGMAYWKWISAGQKLRLGQQWLDLAIERDAKVERRVELGDLGPPELVDNRRAIAKREAKLAKARGEYQQAAIKLSLFLRDDAGQPVVPPLELLPTFPLLRNVTLEDVELDIVRAEQSRPELAAIAFQLQSLQVDYAEAINMTRPGLDAQLVGAQDMGEPTSKKRDKSEFELEAALFFEVPLERRKGLGKMTAVQGKIAQVSAKRQMVRDKVAAEVRAVYAALAQSREAAEKARVAVELASQMADIERTKFEAGESDLLKVALREQYALEAAEELISAKLIHFYAFADYAAIMALDRPEQDLLPAAE